MKEIIKFSRKIVLGKTWCFNNEVNYDVSTLEPSKSSRKRRKIGGLEKKRVKKEKGREKKKKKKKEKKGEKTVYGMEKKQENDWSC